MYSNVEKITPKYERRISELLEQVKEYESQIYQYKALLEDKDYHITLLYNENLELKAQIQNLQQPATRSPAYTPQLHPPPSSSQTDQLTPIPKMPTTNITPAPTMLTTTTPPLTKQTSITSPPTIQTTTKSTPRAVSTTMKRQCPNCGASGFAIREIDDKTRIISYIPRRIYAKKKHCTKCGYEF